MTDSEEVLVANTVARNDVFVVGTMLSLPDNPQQWPR